MIAMKNDIERYLNQVNRAQIKGISALYNLIGQIESNQMNCVDTTHSSTHL